MMCKATIAARLGLGGAQAAVLDHIEARGGMSHQTAADIGKAIGFSMAAANQALHRLRGLRLIWVDGYKQKNGIGKPIPVYRLNEPVIRVLLNEQSGMLGQELAEAYADEGRA